MSTTFYNGKRNSGGRKQNQTYPRLETSYNATQVHSFLELFNHFRSLIKFFAKIAAPLTYLIITKNCSQWTKIEKNFDQLKNRLSCSPVLQGPDSFLSYELSADASEVGVRVLLTQTSETGRGPVASCSRNLNHAEQGYYTHGRELPAAIHALRTLRLYLHGSKFKILADHHSFKYLDFQNPFQKAGQMCRVYVRI